jgi:DNA-directed RNA polymerase specialized sigma24 family protein/ribosome-associated translation inhibitor RaiA
MNVHISYKLHRTPQLEKNLNHLIDKLRKRLQVFRPELVHLKGAIEQNSPREGTTVSLNLRLPSGQLAAQKSATAPEAAIKSAFDDLLQQVTRHKDLLRSSHKWQRRRTQNGRLQSQVPFEQTIAAVQTPTVSPEDVRLYVNANLSRLERFVERELVFREAAEQILPDAVSKDEVIDEAVARALGDDIEKPERLSLEPWLYRLAIHAITDLAARSRDIVPSVHLGDSARTPNVRASDEPGLQFHQPDETLTEENVIADRRLSTPEDIAYSDEMIALVQLALHGAKRTDREAFVLNIMEGFSAEETAVITDRRPEEVRLSVAAVREHLRRSPPLADRFKNTMFHNAAAD